MHWVAELQNKKPHPCGDVRVNPVLPVFVHSVAEVDQHCHKGGEVGKGGACCEPELLKGNNKVLNVDDMGSLFANSPPSAS